MAVSRQFHEALVGLCGNQSLIAMAGALESLWSSHEQGWAPGPRGRRGHAGRPAAAGEAHQRIIDLIAAGRAQAVHGLVAEHLASAQRNPRPATAVIDPTLIRGPVR